MRPGRVGVKDHSTQSDDQSGPGQGHWKMQWSMVTLGVTLQEPNRSKGPTAGSCVEQGRHETFAEMVLTRKYFMGKRPMGHKERCLFLTHFYY